MLQKIKNLKEIIEPKANKLGISFEEMLEVMDDDERFDFFMKQYRKKIKGTFHYTNAIKISSDLKSIKLYLSEKYQIKDSKYINLFINYLSEYIQTNPKDIDRIRRDALLTCKGSNTRLNPYSTYEPYSNQTYIDISSLFVKLNIKPIYHLKPSELSLIIRDKEYEEWLYAPSCRKAGNILTLVGESPIRYTPEREFNIGMSYHLIYEKYMEYLIGSWIKKNTEPDGEREERRRRNFGSFMYVGDLIDKLIKENPAVFPVKDCFDRSKHKMDIYFLEYNIPTIYESSEISKLLNHFTEFKDSILTLLNDGSIKKLYDDDHHMQLR